MRHALAILLGAIAALAVLAGLAPAPPGAPYRLVAEDASAPLDRIGIHYAPAADARALPVYRRLLAALPARVGVDVAVASDADFERFVAQVGVDRARFRAVVVGHELTTWSRDRFAALVDAGGRGGVLAPPRVEAAFAARVGDMESPHAFARAVFGVEARTARVVFQGGDLAASASTLFVGADIVERSRGRGAADRASIDAELRRHFGQRIVWLGDAPGDVPRHHVMMYMVPLDDRRVLVGDPAAGAALAGDALALDADLDGHVARFDRVAAILADAGFAVERIPVAILDGAGAYVTYTNALFDRDGDQPVVYLPTYALPALDDAAARRYRELGYEVRPVDVSGIYHLNGSLGCLVNVLARGPR